MKRTGVDRPLHLGSLLLIIVLFLYIIIPTAGAEERQSIRVGFFAFDGYHMMDENGERSGYGYEFLRMARGW